VAGNDYYKNALANRKEWASHGEEIVSEYMKGKE
jgi:hypothetical protein